MISSDAHAHRHLDDDVEEEEEEQQRRRQQQEATSQPGDQAATAAPTKNDDNDNDEKLVLIQFTDLDDANYCQQFSQKFNYINIESKSPIIQIGNRLYSGEYQNNIGTYLLFEEETGPISERNSARVNEEDEDGAVHSNEAADTTTTTTAATSSKSSSSAPVAPTTANYSYKGKTFKRLVLSRLFVEEKDQ